MTSSQAAGSRGAPDPIGSGRALLRGYGVAWVERALRGTVLRAAAPDDPVEALFVDLFAGAEHPLPAGALPVPVQVLARLFAPARSEPSRARALLVEEDPVKVDWLLEACRSAGLGERAGRGAAPTSSLEIALLESPADQAEPALQAVGDPRQALALLDPPSAGRLSLERLLALVRTFPSLDLLLRFPASDLRRLAAFRDTPLADLPPYARRAAEGISRLLGDPRHEWAAVWRTRRTEADDSAAEQSVVDLLADRLRRASGRSVRIFRAEAGAGTDPVLVSSADPARLLLMNEVVFEARAAGTIPWPTDEVEFVRYLPRAELELFGSASSTRAGAAEPRDRAVDGTALAHSLAVRFAGRRVPFREVLASVLDTELFEADVRRALAELRRDGRALYRSLSQPDAEVAFPRAGTAARAVPSRSARRRAGEEELSFLPDSESD